LLEGHPKRNATRASLVKIIAFVPRPSLVAATLVSVIGLVAVLRPIEARLLQLAVDSLLAGERPGFVTAVSAQIGLAAFAALLFGRWRYLRTTWAGELAANLRKATARHLLSMPLPSTERLAAGEIGSRMTTDAETASKVLDVLYELLRDLVLALTATGYMIILDWRVGLAAALASPLASLLAERLSRPISSLGQRLQQGYADLASFTAHSVANSLAVRVFELHGPLSRRFDALNDKVSGTGVSLGRRMALLEAVAWVGGIAPLFIPFGYGGYLAFHQVISPGTIFAILYLSNYTRGPLTDLGSRLGELRRCLGGASDILDMVQPVVDQAVSGPASAKPTRTAGVPANIAIAIRDLSYAYDAAADPVVRDVSLSIPQGRVAFIVGRSGSGKTTLLKILGGLYDLSPGHVFLDGEDLHHLRARQSLRAIYVPQSPWLFPWSLRENLTLARPGATEEEIRAALHATCADFVEGFPEGLETVVAEAGSSLSEGQKARVCIARALLAGPSVLLLDEPTSGLDALSEEELIRRLRVAMDGRTFVVVTHRLSQVRGEDWVVVMGQGKVLEEGSHDELATSGGPYEALLAEACGAETEGSTGDGR